MNDRSKNLLANRRLPAWIAYPAVVVLEAALTAFLFAIEPYLPLHQYPTPYVLIIMFVAYLWGVGPAVLAFFVGLVAFDYYFAPPYQTLFPHAESPEGWAGIVAYLLGAFIVATAMILIRDSKRRTERIAGELRESREDLSHAQAVAQIGSWRLDVRLNQLLWSDEVYRMFGLPVGAPLTYESFLGSVHPDDREYVERNWNAALAGETYDIEHRITVGEAVKWVHERAELEFDSEGGLLGGFGTVQDVTQLKQAESILEAGVRILRDANIGDKSLDETVQLVLDEIESLTCSSIAFYHFLDEDQETLSLQSWSTNTLETMCTASGKGEHYPISQAGVWVDCVREHHPVIHNDYASLPHRKGLPEGHAPVIRELVVPIFREERIVAVVGVGNKLTDYDERDVEIIRYLGDLSWVVIERRRAEEAVARSGRKLTEIIESINESFWAVDSDWNYIYINKRQADAVGMRPEDIIGQNVWATFPNLKGTVAEESYRAAMEKREPRRFETTGAYKDKWFDVRVYPSEEGISVLASDITDRRKAEEALRKEQEHKLDFYRRTIEAATDGKLIICEWPEIERTAGPRIATWAICSPADIKVVRHGVEDAARSAGIDGVRLGRLAVAVGEAVTNSVKHASEGVASLHRTDDSLIVVVADCGPGIPALALPDVALRPKYSTAGTLGMGYKMMIQFADKIYLATGPEGTTVGVAMALHPDKPAPGA